MKIMVSERTLRLAQRAKDSVEELPINQRIEYYRQLAKHPEKLGVPESEQIDVARYFNDAIELGL